MNTRQEMENELQARLQVANNSSLFSADRLTALIKQAHLWATGLFPWESLRSAKMTGTNANIERYAIPTDFRTHDIYRVEVDGEKYDRIAYEDFEDYRTNNPNSTKKIFALFRNEIFLNPIPTTNGSNNLVAWGSKQPEDLSSSTSETIFSNRDVEGNEAIVKKAFSVAILRIDPSLSLQEEATARAMLAELFSEEKARSQRDMRLDHPRFDVPDYFQQSKTSTRQGNFSLRDY